VQFQIPETKSEHGFNGLTDKIPVLVILIAVNSDRGLKKFKVSKTQTHTPNYLSAIPELNAKRKYLIHSGQLHFAVVVQPAHNLLLINRPEFQQIFPVVRFEPTQDQPWRGDGERDFFANRTASARHNQAFHAIQAFPNMTAAILRERIHFPAIGTFEVDKFLVCESRVHHAFTALSHSLN
jgi:hypothetical protein